MSTDLVKYLPGFKAADTLAKHRFVKPGTGGSAGSVVLAGASDRPIGVNLDGGIAQLQPSCVVKVEAGANLTAGAQVGCGADGKLVAKAGATDIVLGWVKEAWSSGEIAECFVGIYDGS